MKKLTLSLGITAVAAAFVLSMATAPSAHANKYWRFAPGQTQIDPEDCTLASPDVCANVYNDAGTQLISTVRAEYHP